MRSIVVSRCPRPKFSTPRNCVFATIPHNLLVARPSRHHWRKVRATAEELSSLGLSEDEVSTVEGVIIKTGATDIARTVQTLTSFAGSASAARALVVRHPGLLCCQLQSWVEFLLAFGLNKSQVQHVLCQAPETLVEGDLLRAGQAILVFRRLGLDEYAAAQLVTYYPQLLVKDEEEIRKVLGILGRYQTGIDTLSC